MVYRKGEQPVEVRWPDWDCGWHPVRQMMESGDGWFYAWYGQASTSWDRLERETGISMARMYKLDHGAPVTRAEIEAFARVWRADPEQVIQSIPPDLVVG